jgi:hypothetical protein
VVQSAGHTPRNRVNNGRTVRRAAGRWGWPTACNSKRRRNRAVARCCSRGARAEALMDRSDARRSSDASGARIKYGQKVRAKASARSLPCRRMKWVRRPSRIARGPRIVCRTTGGRVERAFMPELRGQIPQRFSNAKDNRNR